MIADHLAPANASDHFYTSPPPLRLKVTTLMDPFDALMESNLNEAQAAELCGCSSVAEFYRKLEAADADKFQRGVQAKLAVAMSQLITTVQGRILERLTDEENPVSDKTLVDLLTKTIPALSQMTAASAANGSGAGRGSAGEELTALMDVVRSMPVDFRQALLGDLES